MHKAKEHLKCRGAITGHRDERLSRMTLTVSILSLNVTRTRKFFLLPQTSPAQMQTLPFPHPTVRRHASSHVRTSTPSHLLRR